MDAWKAMLAASVVLALFAVVVSVAEIELTGPVVVGVLVGAAVASGVIYVVSKRGYRIGRQVGENMRED